MRRLILQFAVLLLLSPAFARGDLLINEYLASNDTGLLDEDGERVDWIELHNSGDVELALDGYWLSDDEDLPRKWVMPDQPLAAGAFLLIYASGKADAYHPLHTNFKLAASGEILLLGSPDGLVRNRLATGVMPVDVSRGRVPDGGSAWFLFAEPSPGSANETAPFVGLAAAPESDPPDGLHAGPLLVELSSPSPGATIRYEIGGAPATELSPAYSEPVAIAASTVIRALAFAPGMLPSPEAKFSYLIGESGPLPRVSLIADPPDFFDHEIGIYVYGDSYNPDYPYYGANFWQDWERPIHVQLFEADGARGFAVDAGVKIHGGWSRANGQKSLRVILRDRYGPTSIDYPVFPGELVGSFSVLILRSGGNDWSRAYLRDAFAHRLAEGTGLDALSYRPTILHINGAYWGVHNLRERADVNTLAAHHGLRPEDIDLLEGDSEILGGDSIHYTLMRQFILNNDLAEDSAYEELRGWMDTENFAEYMIHEIYLGSTDWPGKNIRYWRPRRAGGRWRWILTDLDFTLGRREGPEHDTLRFATEADSPGAANPLWSTFILRNLLLNDGFRTGFINRFADRMNANLHPAYMQATLDEMQATIEPEMARHQERWSQTLEQWHGHLQVARDYVNARPDLVRGQIMAKFGLADTLHLSLDVDPPGAGVIALTAIRVGRAWSGTYYSGLPIPMTAEPAPGYVFSGWSDPELPQAAGVTIAPDGDYAVTARFALGGVYPGQALINEISYNAAPGNNAGDWVELFNPGGEALDLGGWTFKDGDDGHGFSIPAGTTLAGGGHLILARDLALFRSAYPLVLRAVGDFGFGLSTSGERLRLYDPDGNFVDAVTYGVESPWPAAANGTGPSLELRSPAMDNALAASWAAGSAPGTPGAVNGSYLPVEVTQFQGASASGRTLLNAEYRSVGQPAEFRILASGNARNWELEQVAVASDASISASDENPLLRYGGQIAYTLLARKLGEQEWRAVAATAVAAAAQAPLPNLLGRPFPNPFNGATNIVFGLAAAGEARLSVHDARGRLVALLAEGAFAAGFHSRSWDGRDEGGRPLASGVYFVRLSAGGFDSGEKLTIVR